MPLARLTTNPLRRNFDQKAEEEDVDIKEHLHGLMERG